VEVNGGPHDEAPIGFTPCAPAAEAVGKEARSQQPSEDPFRVSFPSLRHNKRRSRFASVCSKYGSEVRLRGQATATREDWAADAMEARQTAGLSGSPLGSCQRLPYTPDSALQTGAEIRAASPQAKARAAAIYQPRAGSGKGLLLLSPAARNGWGIPCTALTKYASSREFWREYRRLHGEGELAGSRERSDR
jgi:hypothetical protein